MTLRRVLPVVLIACAAPTSLAQSEPSAADVGVEVTIPSPAAPNLPAPPVTGGELQVDPVSKVPLRGLPWRMANFMKGERILSVGWGDYRPDVEWKDADFKRLRTTLERAQMIAEKQSSKEMDLIPFRVGASLVIAPETRDVINPDMNKLDRFTASGRGTLIAEVLAALTPAQMRQIGSPAGLAVSSLNADLQRAVARAFRGPLKVVRNKPSTYTSDNGLKHNVTEQEDVGKIEEDFDWSRVRIRANLRTQGANVDLGRMGAYLGGNEGESLVLADATDSANYVPWEDRGMALPVYVEGPNTFKPSDLEGRRFPQPLGLSGVWYVKDVLAKLGSATGLKLKAAPLYDEEPVFLGSPAITVGETIDALRLGLTAAFRKLGDTYLLAWDRLGLAAIQQIAHDASYGVSRDLRKRARELERDNYLLSVAKEMPFAADDPLALTADQRSKAYGAQPKPEDVWSASQIRWEEMTPEQQAFLRKRSETDSIDLPGEADGQAGTQRPFTDDDLRKATLMGSAWVEVSIQTPEHGWVRASQSWNLPSVSPWQLNSIRSRNDPEAKNRMMESMPKEMRDALEHPKPAPLPSDVRVAMVPPLSTARLNTLAKELKRHGFTTLLYPALYGGYATFPTAAFPLHPSLKGEDGFAAAVAAMKPAGIQVAAYLNVLTWQDEADKVHWLSKHPDWIDVDVTGTPRLQWLAAHPDAGLGAEFTGEYRANYVRASEPMVEARLKLLLGDLAKVKDVKFVAFSQWSVNGSGGDRGPLGARSIPRLGYSLPDRIAAFKATGMDPVDRVSWNDYLPQSLRNRGIQTDGEPQATANAPQSALLGRLIQQARTLRKDWKVWTFSEQLGMGRMEDSTGAGPAAKDAPKPDLTIRSAMEMGGGSPPANTGVTFPITNTNLFAALSAAGEAPDDDVPDALKNITPMGLYTLFRTQMPTPENAKPPAFVLDFRTAPNQITTSLEWISAK